VVDLPGGIGPICVYSCFICGVISSIYLAPHYQGIVAQPLPPVAILRLAENPFTRSKNKVALSFQRHTGVPPLQPDVAMLML
jgi:hypothetical protein